MAVVDASIYVALVKADEDAHAASWTWFRQALAQGESVAAPMILLAEVAAALSRGVGDKALAHQVVRQLLQAQLIELFPVTGAMGSGRRPSRPTTRYEVATLCTLLWPSSGTII